MEKDQVINSSYIIPINDDYLYYSPLAGISALLNRPGVLELQKQMVQAKGENETHGNQGKRFYNLAQDVLNSPVRQPARKTGKLNPEFLGIIPTRACNGACKYCDFGADKASAEKMPYWIATKIIDWFANELKAHQRNVMEVHFFGGEPMVARDVIEVVIHRARWIARKLDLSTYFEISTNGQFDKANAGFLGKYFNKVVLSLDGFKEVHDTHRPVRASHSSFEQAAATAKIIGNSGAELCIRCCISRLNVMQMEEITQWLCGEFRISTINFEILCETAQTVAAGLFPPDPVIFALHFQKSRAIAEQFGVDVVYASDISDTPVVSSCPVGKDAVIVSPDGRLSNCYLLPERWLEAGLGLDFGSQSPDGSIKFDQARIDSVRTMVEDKPRCLNCFCRWSCAGGCHVGNTFPGCNPGYDNFCIQTRLISAFTLLSDLDAVTNLNVLMNSEEALQHIAHHPSDKLSSFNT